MAFLHTNRRAFACNEETWAQAVTNSQIAIRISCSSDITATNQMPAKYYRARTSIKRIVWKLQRYEPQTTAAHVALFATRRGGSSWIMQVISASPEFRYIAQPFVAYDKGGHWGHGIVSYDYARFLDPTEDELTDIGGFIDGILSGRYVLRAPWRVWEPNFWRRKSRTVMKILQAKPLMPWFERQFGMNIVYLLRHPLAQASSVIKSGWPSMHMTFLNHSSFVEKNLDAEQMRYCMEIASQGSLLDQHVLTWCLDNLVALRALKTPNSWTVITYEDCVLHPQATIQSLADALNLSSTQQMQRQMSVVSRTARFSNESDSQVLGESQLAKWKKNVSKDEIASAFDILKALDIDAYSADSLLPSDKLQCRGLPSQ